MIICHHSHRISGYEIHNGVPIFYGLGNFMFKAKNKPTEWHIGMQLNISIGDKITFDIKIAHFDVKTNILSRLSETEQKAYISKIESLSEIIKDQNELEKKLDEFADLQSDYYLKMLHNKTSRLHGILIDRLKMHSFFFKKEQNLRFLNYFYCDAHAFIIKKILEKLNDK